MFGFYRRTSQVIPVQLNRNVERSNSNTLSDQ